MGGQFDKETSNQNYEWHRERAIRETKINGKERNNRIDFNLRAVEKKHGEKAAKELAREVDSQKNKGRKYFT